MKETSFSLEDRNKIIAKIVQIRGIVAQLSNDIEKAPDDENLLAHLSKEYDKALNELQELGEEYSRSLPQIRISCCPFSGDIFSFSCDTFGLDGPWWDVENPIRGFEVEYKTFFALTGSVNIIGDVPDIPFMVKPGPGIPWVSPRLLDNDDIIAVLSYIKIGLYDAYVIVYFSNNKTYEIERINTWGKEDYLAEDSDGCAVIGSTFEDDEEYDFDIAKWINNGKLKWISIKDKTLELQDSIDNCPFLDIEGYKYPVLIQNKNITNCLMTEEFDENENEDKETKPINFCPNCGTAATPGNKFCGSCGHKLT